MDDKRERQIKKRKSVPSTNTTTTSSRLLSRRRQKTTLLVLLSVTLLWCFAKTYNPKTFPIRSVQIVDAQSNVNHTTLRETISPFLADGMVRLKVHQLQNTLLTLPWIKTVIIQRQWPDKLIITLTEQNAAAHWDKSKLLDDQGNIFAPRKIPATLNNLPWLSGPDINAPDILANYQTMSAVITSLGLKITAINLSQNNSWEIQLNNGLPIVLGKDDALIRLKRFVEIYPKIFDNNANAVEYIDLRYNNGLAVKWKGKE